MFYLKATHSFYETIASIAVRADEALMILSGEKSGLDIEKLTRTLSIASIAYGGAFFPNVLYQGKAYSEGIIVKKLPMASAPFVVPLEKSFFRSDNIESAIPSHYKESISFITWTDAMNPLTADFLHFMQQKLPLKSALVGGGAGFSDFQQRPCLFSKEGFMQDAALIFPVAQPSSIAAQHGWERLAGPFLATQTDGNKLVEINWDTAQEVFTAILQEKTGIALDHENFASVAHRYPIGLLQDGKEELVRDMLQITPQGELVFFGDIPPNTTFYLLHGNSNNMQIAAQKAITNSVQQPNTIKDFLLVSCVSRAFFDAEQYAKEMQLACATIKKLNNDSITLEGVESIGEISSENKGSIQFLNKTVVAISFFEPVTT